MPIRNFPGNQIHLDLPAQLTGYRLCPDNSFWSLVTAGGTVINLKDLGLEIFAYNMAGMPPIQNLSTPYGLLGGEYYQRTTVKPRTLTLMCYIQGENLKSLQRIRQALINYVAPNTATQQGAQIKLRYALTDGCGNVIGTTLEMACYYVGGLEGATDNLYQERLALQFIEFAPPSIVELTTQTPGLSFQGSPTANNQYAIRASGGWSFINPAHTPQNAFFDQNNTLWLLGSTSIRNESGSISVATNNLALAAAFDANNRPYVGGSFTSPSPQNYITYYNGTTWTAVGATINNTVRGLAFDNNGILYAVGDFTLPNNRAAKWNGAAWSQLTAGANLNGTAYCIVKGLDGNMYIGGAFTTADGTTVNGIVRYNVKAGTYSALGTGVAGGSAIVQAIAVGPDGRIYIAGSFTSVNGISASNVAVWNGANWQPLGAGINGTLTGIDVSSSGTVYVAGNFTQTGDGAYTLSPGNAQWNGSTWLPMDYKSNTLAFIKRSPDNSRTVLGVAGIIDKYSTATNVNNTGTAPVYPTIVFSGFSSSGTLYALLNNTTGKAIYFTNFSILPNETITLVTTPNNFSITSSFYGNSFLKILPGSDISSFALQPGINSISALADTSGSGTLSLSYKNTHWSFDASGGV